MPKTESAPPPDRIEIIDENLKYGFAQMPRPVLKAKGLSFRAKCLYCLLLDYAWQQDNCFPGQVRLAEDLGTSTDTVQRGLGELRAYGLIDWEQQGLNKPNVYFILKLSDCPGLSSDGSRKPQKCGIQGKTSGKPQKCGVQKPQKCGNQKPQKCGTKNTQSKNTQTKNTQISSKQTSKGRAAAPAVSYSHEAMTTRNGSTETNQPNREPNTRNGRNAQPTKPERPPAYIGKPLTQDEIDEKRQHGQNASGLRSPLPGIIPHQHLAELEAREGVLSNNGNGHTTHYNNSTRNAPMFIDTTLEQFTELLGDEPGNTARNINRTAKLYRNAGTNEDDFREVMQEAFDQARRYPTVQIKKQRSDGRPNRMPVFFTILAQRLTQHGQT